MRFQPLESVRYAQAHWKSIVIILVPLLFLPLALVPGKESKCGFTICVMAVYWMTEALPLPVTSLIPIVLFPLFGILSTEETCMTYFKETNVMFFGSITMAIAVEHCNLHKRIALRVLMVVGTSPKRLMFGLMITTMFLSMWICNATATAMMTPIVNAVLQELTLHRGETEKKKSSELADGESGPGMETLDCESRGQCEPETETRARPPKEHICYYLGIAYAANIGGTGTITGTGANMTFKGIFESLFPNGDRINFATWMVFNVPLMLLNTCLAWLWLQIIYMGLLRCKSRDKTSLREQEKRIREVISRDYNNLGSMSYHEANILCLFLLDVLLWFFRKPEFVDGWSDWFPDKAVKDATAAIATVVLLFTLPANLDFLRFGGKKQKESPPLLTWKILREKFPLGIILLLGGGFAISKASETSGLSTYLGHQLEVVQQFPDALILGVILLGTTFATEVSSNTAVANILLPVLAKLSRAIRINPLYLMIPTTIACSYAFMLPVATPPNAIVASASNLRTSDMMKAGFGMNLISVAALFICFILFGVQIYDLSTFPDWAETNSTMTVY